MEKIFIGTVKETFENGTDRNYVKGERLYIDRHSWDCDWYWGFGYIGNPRLHCHFDGAFLVEGAPKSVDNIFVRPVLNQKEWTLVCKSFKEAYELKAEAAKHHRSDPETHARLNAMLKDLLDRIWGTLVQADARRQPKAKRASEVI